MTSSIAPTTTRRWRSRGRRLIPIARPVIEAEELEAVRQVLESRRLVQGAKAREFEDRFAGFVGTRHGVATNSGTAALHTALRCLGVGPGDEMILPAITFFSCAAMVGALGATPVAVDVTAEEYTLDPARAQEALTPRTRAMMPVHIFGQPADMGPLLDLAEDHDLAVIEDACQSHGARYEDRMAGSLGTLGCYSFYPSKLITTGEGGMLVTDRDDLADLARKFRNHGGTEKHRHEFLGFNYRMTDLAAALGLEQLNRIDGFIATRTRHAASLTKGLQDLPGVLVPQVAEGRTHVFYQYVLRIENPFPLGRDALIAALNARGIESRPSYPVPIYDQPAYAAFGRAAECPVAERVLPGLLEIPVHPSLSPADVNTIVEAFHDLASKTG